MRRPRTRVAARKIYRVLLVDRHALMRWVAAEWISRCDGLTVCGMAASQAGALRAIRPLRPDIVVCEMLRPENLGFIRELHHRHPRLLILVFSAYDPTFFAARARAAGASGYVSKAAGGKELTRNICALLRRRRQAASPAPGKINRLGAARRQEGRKSASAPCRARPLPPDNERREARKRLEMAPLAV